ncbi:MAG: hypothetical protein HRT44_06075 [Bdellovibrionales bacterium]|nr:hypothetical protein [Bdellovibrionales bacterium]
MQADPLNIIKNDLFNEQSDSNDTPLHQAVRQGHQEASMALMNCRLTAYGYENVFGRNPLSELIAHTDRHTDEIDEARKAIFNNLYQRVTGAWRLIVNPRDYVNNEDEEGQTSLHYAARLRDPFFYEALRHIGDIYAEDDQGNTPDSLFKERTE